MLEAVAGGLAAGARGGAPGLLAVTVLSGLDGAQTAAAFGRTPGELVARLARLAAETGAEGVVCSPKELGVVADVAPGLVKVAAGIREPGGGEDDQLRTSAPAEAVRRGARLLLVGRPIVAAPDPVAAVRRITAGLG
jgi:orotidine-5'-phosphate decarboxylase